MTFEGSYSSHITSTLKQERDKAAKEERQERAGKGSLQFIHDERHIDWDFVFCRSGGGVVKYASLTRETGTRALSARAGDDRPRSACRPLGFRTSFRWPSWSKAQDAATPLRPGCRDALPMPHLVARVVGSG
jgi:hypothetical protein